MKTATFPPLRVDPQLRQDTESVLREGESLSQFIEQAVRSQVELRKANEAFLARGLASRDRARQTGHYVEADVVLGNCMPSWMRSRRVPVAHELYRSFHGGSRGGSGEAVRVFIRARPVQHGVS